MSKFHKTISRRDFMKGLGLAGAGIGAVAASAPVFHDIDEFVSSEANSTKDQPWYVKHREHFDPTITVDWDIFDRYDGYQHKGVYEGPPDAPFTSWGNRLQMRMSGEEQKKRILAAKKERFPGWDGGLHGRGDQRADALFYAVTQPFPGSGEEGHGLFQPYPDQPGKFYARWGLYGPPHDSAPPDGSVPKWEGTPEDNFLMLRAAAKYFGAGGVGALNLADPKCKKLIYKKAQPMTLGKGTYSEIGGPGMIDAKFYPKVPDHAVPINFKEADYSYYNDAEWVIPTKCESIFTFTLPQPQELNKRTGGIAGAGPYTVYKDFARVGTLVQMFIKNLGYHALYWPIGWGPGGCFTTFDGQGEQGRTGAAIHWKFGSSQRGSERVVTDLPIAPTPPIDAGMFEFCKTCYICRDVCVSGGVHQEDEPTWDSGNWWNVQGYLGYRTDWSGCHNQCGMCQSSCPFTYLGLENASLVHKIVKGVVANTTVFNSFFTNMEKALGYGDLTMENSNWWKEEGPIYGFDPGT
uniref:Vinyl chloride reductase n=1 Tax=uncultured Dehalococcoides sp. TaxID=171952 RepID=G5EJ67_9CHLR|nr:vinyl chloride reductase [uncultured Dehalococcoides sp.]